MVDTIHTLRRAEYSGESATCQASDCENTFMQRSVGSIRRYCSRRCATRVYHRNLRAAGVLPAHKRPGAPRCKVEGCSESRFAWEMCVMHYNRKKLFGDAGEAAPRRARRGASEWRVTSDGYVRRSNGDQPELQHRVVMEEFLGRSLLQGENVHHRNGLRHDNRIENLELWSKWQPAGQRVIDKLTWAREILARYDGVPEEILGSASGTPEVQESGTMSSKTEGVFNA